MKNKKQRKQMSMTIYFRNQIQKRKGEIYKLTRVRER